MKLDIFITYVKGNKLCRNKKFTVWSFETSAKFLPLDLALLTRTTQFGEHNRPNAWAVDRTRSDKILIYSSLSKKHTYFCFKL